MRSKVDFYKQFFEQLARRGFEVKRAGMKYHRGYRAKLHWRKICISPLSMCLTATLRKT
jgi:hypothetical protein